MRILVVEDEPAAAAVLAKGYLPKPYHFKELLARVGALLRLVAGEMYTLVVDGREVATVAADVRGRIAIELNVPLPGAASPR